VRAVWASVACSGPLLGAACVTVPVGGDVYTPGDRPGAIAPSAGGGPAPAARQPPGAPLTTLLVGDRAAGASEAAPPGPAE